MIVSYTETGGGTLFNIDQEAETIITTLNETGHKKLEKTMQTENSTTKGIVNNTVRQKQSKVIDMRFYWI